MATTIQSKYHTGDKVIIRTDSQYFGQHEGVGEISNVYGPGIYQVKWPDKYANAYYDEDLDLVKPKTKQKPVSIIYTYEKQGKQVCDLIQNKTVRKTGEGKTKYKVVQELKLSSEL